MASDAKNNNGNSGFQIASRTAGGAHEVVKVHGNMAPDVQAALAQVVLANTPDGTHMPTVPANQLPGVQQLNSEQSTVPMRMPVGGDLPNELLVEAADTTPLLNNDGQPRTQPLLTAEERAAAEARRQDDAMLRELRRNVDLQKHARAARDEEDRYALALNAYRDANGVAVDYNAQLMGANPAGAMPLPPLTPEIVPIPLADGSGSAAAAHLPKGSGINRPQFVSNDERARIEHQLDGWDA